MFPISHVSVIVRFSNENLQKEKLSLARHSEILKFFGVIVLMTRFKFGTRDSLWSTTPTSRYVPPANIGRTGMRRTRFRNLRRAIRFSKQGPVDEESWVRDRG
jgi:Transposase IS4